MNRRFISKVELKSIIDYSELIKNPLAASSIFMWERAEIVFVERNGSLLGILTFGDFLKDENHANKGDVEFLNKSFKYVTSEDEIEKAEEIRKSIPTISIIPIVQGGVLKGVLKLESARSESYQELIADWFRRRIEEKEIEKLISKSIESHVFFYNPPSLSEIEKYEPGITTIINDRYKNYRQDLSIPYLDRMGEELWIRFYGGKADYEEKFPKVKNAFLSITTRIEDGFLYFNDYVSDGITYRNGSRDTSQRKGAKKRILIFGPCYVVGFYVIDSDTLSYRLERIIESEGFENYAVINCGSVENYYLNNLFKVEIGSEDIVIICADTRRNLEKLSSDKFHFMGSLSESYSNVGRPSECMVDNPMHCNGIVSKNMSKVIYNDIKDYLYNDDKRPNERVKLADKYPLFFEKLYFKSYIEHYMIKALSSVKTGAIVMNCNPFTLGHKYLIETASKQVDRLIIFVVEENKSKFIFNDRLFMVKMGTQDIENVEVYPSGELIISQKTFSDYFEKDTVINPTTPEYDVRLFGEVVAKGLNITSRFVGEEPFDIVTRNYNETMKKILPGYGVEVIEIKRKEQGDDVISASLVRKYMDEKDLNKIRNLVPESTYNFLRSLI